MKRSHNTAIEEFITKYGNDISDDNDCGLTPITIMDDIFEAETPNSFSYSGGFNNSHTQQQAKKSRFQLLSEGQEYDFMKLVAGSMQVDVETLYEHEDMDRVIQTDYDLQLSEKKRLLAQENKTRKVTLIKARTAELKTQLIDQSEKDMIDSGYDTLQEIGQLVGDEYDYRYERLCRESMDYDVVLNEKSDPEALIAFMERYYETHGLQDNGPNTFAIKFRESELPQEALKGIAIQTLWYRDLDPSNEHHQFVDDITDAKLDIDIPIDVQQEALAIKEEPVVVTYIKNEESNYKRGMMMALPNNDMGTTYPHKHDSYSSFMGALIDARNDIMTRNNLLKGVSITSIHTTELNQKIQSMKNPSITEIIDTSKEYFKDLYSANSNPITLYADMADDDAMVATMQKQKTDLSSHRDGKLLKERRFYDKFIVPRLDQLVIDITNSEQDTMVPMLNNKTLANYRTRISKGNVTRDEIISNLIVNPAFKHYYMVNSRPLDNKRHSYLHLCKLFLLLAEYLPKHDTEIHEKILANDNTLAQLDDTDIDSDGMTIVSQQQQNTKIQVKPNVVDKIDEAYHLMIEYCEELYGLPLVAVKSKRSIDAGLAGDFARYVAALFADANLLYPDSYKSKAAHDKVTLRKSEMMNRLKKYSYTRRNGGAPHDCYSIFKSNNQRNGSNPFYFI